MSWSFDGRLAFTAWFYFSSLGEGDVSEIYLWDGFTITNLSQNSTGRDEGPAWSSDGRLAFLSERDDRYDIYVWDGVSVKGGLPDRNTFANISPELTEYFSYETWTNDRQLAFQAISPQDTHSQIYLWDGRTASNISQNPEMHNGGANWNHKGQWAFSTFFSPEQLIYIRDADNQTIFTVEGQGAAWSLLGYLLFCTQQADKLWVLSMWDGHEIIKVAEGGEIWAQWQSGDQIYCTNG